MFFSRVLCILKTIKYLIYRWWNWEKDRLTIGRGCSAGLWDNRDSNWEFSAPGTLITTEKRHEQQTFVNCLLQADTATGAHLQHFEFPHNHEGKEALLFPLNRWWMWGRGSECLQLVKGRSQVGTQDFRLKCSWIDFWTTFKLQHYCYNNTDGQNHSYLWDRGSEDGLEMCMKELFGRMETFFILAWMVINTCKKSLSLRFMQFITCKVHLNKVL